MENRKEMYSKDEIHIMQYYILENVKRAKALQNIDEYEQSEMLLGNMISDLNNMNLIDKLNKISE